MISQILVESWRILVEAGAYILLGILAAGILKVFLSPATVAAHLGRGRFLPVIKAALFGIPLPLCSCGVLPAAAALKKQGANNGATTAFLVSTPESGVDSIAVTYALMDPVMTVARPVAALVTAISAGFAGNLINPDDQETVSVEQDLTCQIDGCCDGTDCPPEEHADHHSWLEKVTAGLRFAFFDVWEDIVVWFFVGLLLSGIITVLIPDGFISHHLGGGISSMLLMLLIGIPIYICATGSTPVAASMVMKGASPGTAMVFLLSGPATNLTALSVITGMLGKRGTVIYLAALVACSVAAGLAIDALYLSLGISASAAMGKAGKMLPEWIQLTCAVILLLISIPPVFRKMRGIFQAGSSTHEEDSCCGPEKSCGIEEKDETEKPRATGKAVRKVVLRGD